MPFSCSYSQKRPLIAPGANPVSLHQIPKLIPFLGDRYKNRILAETNFLAGKLTYTQDELIARIRDKDQKAFSYLYDHYSEALSGVVQAIVKDPEEAEDVIQNVFLKIWNNFASYDETKGRLYTWMLNIARNQAIDNTRSKHHKIKSKIQAGESSVYLANNLRVEDTTHESIGLKPILEQLKEDHKVIIDLAYFEGYTQEEISKKLEMPLGTVKTKVRQALLTLRNLTKKEFLE